MNIKIAFFVGSCMLALLVYTGSIYSSELMTKSVLVLSIPSPSGKQKSMEPVPYKVIVPGEFLDVDLPDEVKAKKYKDTYIAENAVNEHSTNLTNKPHFSIQLAMFKNAENAKRFKETLLKQYFPSYIVSRKNSNDKIRYDVRFGQYATRHQAEIALRKYNAAFKPNGFIVNN